jgi:hypothetical protein
MAGPYTLAQMWKIIAMLPPAADAAGRTSPYWVTLKECDRCVLVVHVNQGNAATVLLTPLQATNVAGAGSVALTQNARIWYNIATATSDALVRQTDGLNFTTDVTVANKIVLFDIDAASLNQAGGFVTVGISTGASNVANITSCVAFLGEQRHAGDTLPSQIIN